MTSELVSIITPVKDERENLPELVKSVETQSLKPHQWVIVNDGSSDGSKEYIQRISNKISYIEGVHRDDDDEEYDIGSHYSQVLHDGYQYVLNSSDPDPDYYMILDGDMSLTTQYIETLVDYLENTKSMVIASGGIYVNKNGRLELEHRLKNQPAGGATLYDGEFYQDIGGPPLTPCVDSITKSKARLRGYECRYLTDVDIKAIQSRPTGQKGDLLQNQFQRGRDRYKLNDHPVTIAAKTAERLMSYPYYHAFAFCAGYYHSLITGVPQIEDPELKAYYWQERPKELYELVLEKLSIK